MDETLGGAAGAIVAREIIRAEGKGSRGRAHEVG